MTCTGTYSGMMHAVARSCISGISGMSVRVIPTHHVARILPSSRCSMVLLRGWSRSTILLVTFVCVMVAILLMQWGTDRQNGRKSQWSGICRKRIERFMQGCAREQVYEGGIHVQSAWVGGAHCACAVGVAVVVVMVGAI